MDRGPREKQSNESRVVVNPQEDHDRRQNERHGDISLVAGSETAIKESEGDGGEEVWTADQERDRDVDQIHRLSRVQPSGPLG
jgi:hypothetical protein